MAYKKIDLSFIIRNTAKKPAEFDTKKCVGCGTAFKVYASRVWAKFHNRECYKQYLKDKKSNVSICCRLVDVGRSNLLDMVGNIRKEIRLL